MRPALAACSLIAACAPSPERSAVLPEIPPDVTRVAAFTIDARETILSGTPLQRYSPGGAIALPEDPSGTADLMIAGFRHLDLANVPLPSEEVLASAPLIASDGARPIFPDPSLVAVAAKNDGVYRFSATASRPKFSASWLPECAQRLEAPTPLVDISCAPLFCGASATQNRCELAIDSGACALGTLSATRLANGGLRASPETCLENVAPEGALLSLRCEDKCNVTVYPPAGAAKIAASTTAVIDVEPRFEREFHTPVVGYLGGLAVLADRVIAFTHAGGWADDCLSRDHGTGVILDPDTMEIRTRFETPPCVAAAAADPRGTGYFALYGAGQLYAGKFTADGILVAERPVPLPEPRESYRWSALVVHREEDAITALAMFRQSMEVNAHSYTLAGPELQVRAQSPAVPSRTRTAIELESGRVGLGDQQTDTLFVIDTFTGNEARRVDLGDKCGHANPEQLYYDLVHDRLVVTSVRDHPGINVIDESACAPAAFYERNADAYGIARWVVEPLLLIGATDTTGDRTTYLGLLDPETPRMIPGLVPAGRGPAIDFTRDARGRVWMLFPWTGTIARAEAIDPIEGP